MLFFRHTDTRYGFTWETTAQPGARWHATGDGPAQYLADTPEGAWAEFLRHEEITDPADLAGVTRRVWAIDVPDDIASAAVPVDLPDVVLRGPYSSYQECQQAAAALRAEGAVAIRVPSAALEHAGGYRSSGAAFTAGPARPASNLVVFASGAGWPGWMCHNEATADPMLVSRIRPIG